jgi:hypothetical protein
MKLHNECTVWHLLLDLTHSDVLHSYYMCALLAFNLYNE